MARVGRPKKITINVKEAFGVDSIAAKLLYERKKNSTKPVEIKLLTTAPSKWRIVDMETGEVWKWNDRRNEFQREGSYKATEVQR